jgi:hypothetical protein
MPAVMHESIAFLTSSLGGSCIPTLKKGDKGKNHTRPTKTKGLLIIFKVKVLKENQNLQRKRKIIR